MSVGSNGVVPVRSLPKIPMKLCLANFCVNRNRFCIDFHAVKNRSKMPQNMCARSNGVDRVHSLRKILTWLCLANMCVNGTSSASFASTFVQ
jgi:hypothetical protein